MNINKDKIKLLAEQEKEIDVLVDKIKTSFKTMLNLYRVLTYNISGKYYDVYCNRIFNYQDILTFDKLKIKVKPYGFVESCFLTYNKGWFKKKEFYHACGYSFHAEYDSSTRYKFTVEDYNLILTDLDKTINRLKDEISKSK